MKKKHVDQKILFAGPAPSPAGLAIKNHWANQYCSGFCHDIHSVSQVRQAKHAEKIVNQKWWIRVHHKHWMPCLNLQAKFWHFSGWFNGWGNVAHVDFAQESAAKLQDGQAFQVVNSPGVFRSGRYAIAGHPLSVWRWVFPYHPCMVYICLYIYQQKSTKCKYTYTIHSWYGIHSWNTVKLRSILRWQ